MVWGRMSIAVKRRQGMESSSCVTRVYAPFPSINLGADKIERDGEGEGEGADRDEVWLEALRTGVCVVLVRKPVM